MAGIGLLQVSKRLLFVAQASLVSSELERRRVLVVVVLDFRPGENVRQAFGSEYVFVTPAADRRFYVAAMLSHEFTKGYEDQQCMILKVRESDLTGSN